MTMENKKLEIPKKPFADFKWKWASVQCTEGTPVRDSASN